MTLPLIMSMHKQKNSPLLALLTAGIIVVAAACLLYGYQNMKYQKEEVPPPVRFEDVKKEEEATIPEAEIPEKAPEKRTQLNLDAPFYSQAPFGNWDFPWQEACEEASTLLVANVYWNHNWTREEFNEEILKMVDWQKDRFGTYLDTTVAQTAQILEEYLKLETITHEDPTYEDIQNILNKGHFVIMFFAGKELGNPYFSNGGPNYHVLVVKGYKPGQRIITHDVGTKNGANYVYSWDVLQSAMHDFAVPIQSGAKRILEVLPPK